MLQNLTRYDRGEIKVDAKLTTDGYIKANAIVTRTGIFIYKNSDGTIRKEYRGSEEVFKADSMETLKMIPITNGHPTERFINAKNAKKLAIGYTGENIQIQDQYLIANLLITDEEGVSAITEKKRKELSLGYTVDLLETPGEFQGEKYDFVQTNIKYNHLSLVDQGRAGAKACITIDRLDGEETTIEEIMAEKTKKDQEEEGKSEHVAKLEAELDKVKADLDKAKEELEKVKEEREKLKAERDMLKEEKSSENEDQKKKADAAIAFSKAVKARVILESAARKVLDKETIAKMDSLQDIDLKKAVIKAKCPSAVLDGQSDIYINGRFDGVLETLTTTAEKEDKLIKSDGKNQAASDPVAARNEMIKRNKNACKR